MQALIMYLCFFFPLLYIRIAAIVITMITITQIAATAMIMYNNIGGLEFEEGEPVTAASFNNTKSSQEIIIVTHTHAHTHAHTHTHIALYNLLIGDDI